MGYIKHHVIIVTAFDKEKAYLARTRACRDFTGLVTPVKLSAVNQFYSFAILPDGSKEGWGESNMFDEARGNFMGWLIGRRYEDGSSPYDAIEVWFDEDGKTKSTFIS